MLGVTSNPLPSASRSFDNSVDRFEMARICRKTNFHLRAGCEFSHGPIAEMIFHVAIAGDELRNVILAELGENNAERFLQKIREHVQPPTVRHAHANFLNTSGRTFVKDRVENHHQRFGALDREAFLADVTRV